MYMYKQCLSINELINEVMEYTRYRLSRVVSNDVVCIFCDTYPTRSQPGSLLGVRVIVQLNVFIHNELINEVMEYTRYRLPRVGHTW